MRATTAMAGMRAACIGAALSLSGCAPPETGGCAVGSRAVLAQLYFGRSMPGGLVDDAAWRDFLAGEVTPRFPDGLTVLDGYGQWRAPGASTVGREPSSVIVIAAPGSPETQARLEAIRAAYRARFHQQSVGLVTSSACASF